jgi:hypothetical protein
VRELNLQARAILKERGELGKEARVEVARELAAMMAPSASNAANATSPRASA